MTGNKQFSYNLDSPMMNFSSLNLEVQKDGNNWYIYASNNPINRIDPTGLLDVHAEEDTGTITKNDTLTSIAEERGTTVEELEILNPQIEDPDKIYAGDDITLRSYSNSEMKDWENMNERGDNYQAPEASENKAHKFQVVSGGATLVAGLELSIDYVWDDEGNKGLAITPAIGTGIKAKVPIPKIKGLFDLLTSNAISDSTSYQETDGTINNFSGKTQYNTAHVIAGVTQSDNNKEQFTLSPTVGGGAYWGHTFIMNFGGDK